MVLVGSLINGQEFTSSFVVSYTRPNDVVNEEFILPANLMPEFVQTLQRTVSLQLTLSEEGESDSSDTVEMYTLGKLADYENDPISVEMQFTGGSVS